MADKTAFDYVNEIWSIANYVRDVIRPADYNKLILPFAVLRRFECALEPTRAAVSRQAAKGVWDDDDPKYCALSGHCFYNVTSFTLSNLGASKTCDALMAYISGFSANAREVLQRFEMRQTCEKLDEKGMLYEVCTRFAGFDLGPKAVSDRMMTDIYEHLIQRYGEEISQDAEDFMTPKDVARLATALLFANEDTLLNADEGASARSTTAAAAPAASSATRSTSSTSGTTGATSRAPPRSSPTARSSRTRPGPWARPRSCCATSLGVRETCSTR